jgi:hypothetical protein
MEAFERNFPEKMINGQVNEKNGYATELLNRDYLIVPF